MKKEITLKGKNLIIKPTGKEEIVWNDKWEVLSKIDNTKVGEISFGGPAVKGLVKLKVNVKDEKYREEALRLITSWTLRVSKVYLLETEVEEEDDATQVMLTKLSYHFDRLEGKKKVYLAKKEYTSWVIIFICLVGAIGMIIGTWLNHMAIGFGIGALLGAGIGLFLDWLYIRHHKKIVE